MFPVALLLSLLGCTPSDQDAVAILAQGGPPALALRASNLVAGELVTLTVSGAPPGTVLRFVHSTAGIGAGPCPSALQGQCLGIRGPVTLVPRSVTANGSGTASLSFPVPLPFGGGAIAIQAVAPAGGVVSNPVARLVAPAGTVVGGDADGDGWTVAEGDCADFAATVHPGAYDPAGDHFDFDCNDSDLAASAPTPGTVDVTLDETGGTLVLSDGITLDVPASAIELPTPFYAEPAADPIAASDAGATLLGDTWLFGPEGVELSAPATVTMPLPPGAAAFDDAHLAVLWRHDGRSYLLPTTVDRIAGTASAEVGHFSEGTLLGLPPGTSGVVGPDGGLVFLGNGLVFEAQPGAFAAPTTLARQPTVIGEDGTQITDQYRGVPVYSDPMDPSPSCPASAGCTVPWITGFDDLVPGLATLTGPLDPTLRATWEAHPAFVTVGISTHFGVVPPRQAIDVGLGTWSMEVPTTALVDGTQEPVDALRVAVAAFPYQARTSCAGLLTCDGACVSAGAFFSNVPGLATTCSEGAFGQWGDHYELAGGRSYADADLSDLAAFFSGVMPDLEWVTLRDVVMPPLAVPYNVDTAVFERVDASGARFGRIDSALMIDTDLSNAEISEIQHSSFRGCDLTNVDLSDLDLISVEFDATTVLDGVVWEGAACPDDTLADDHGSTCIGHLTLPRPPDDDYVGVYVGSGDMFYGLDLRGVNLDGVVATGLQLSGNRIDSTVRVNNDTAGTFEVNLSLLEGASLVLDPGWTVFASGTLLNTIGADVVMDGVQAAESVLQIGEVVVSSLTLSGPWLDTVIYNFNLDGLTFQDGILRDARIFGGSARNAVFLRATLDDSVRGFDHVDLQGASFVDTVIEDWTFQHVNLLGADFSTATLQGAVRWIDVLCPDGTWTEENGGSCVGHLSP